MADFVKVLEDGKSIFWVNRDNVDRVIYHKETNITEICFVSGSENFMEIKGAVPAVLTGRADNGN